MKKTQAIRVSANLQREYEAVLKAAIKRMSAETTREVVKAYGKRDDEFLPDMAQDESATAYLQGVLKKLFRRWEKVFSTISEKFGKKFIDRAEKYSTKQIKNILKESGFTVQFRTTSYVQNILNASYAENVSLIKSIPEQYHKQVQTIVSTGIQAGNDQMFIKEELQKQFGVTEKRARMIARDQTMKANGAIARARSAEAGIEYGFWRHRSGSKVPRPTHQAMNGVRFKITEGLFDPHAEKVKGKWIGRIVLPGELVNCRCSYSPDLTSFNPKIAQDSVSFSIGKS